MSTPDPALSGFVLLTEGEHAALLAEVAALKAAGRDLLAQIELAGMVRRNQDREVAELKAESAELCATLERVRSTILPLVEALRTETASIQQAAEGLARERLYACDRWAAWKAAARLRRTRQALAEVENERLRAYSARLLAWVREAVVCLPLSEKEIRAELALEGLILFGTGGECCLSSEALPAGSVQATGGGDDRA